MFTRVEILGKKENILMIFHNLLCKKKKITLYIHGIKAELIYYFCLIDNKQMHNTCLITIYLPIYKIL